MRWIGCLAVVGTLSIMGSSSGADGAASSKTERRVLNVLREGRAAILKDRPEAVCRRLTRRARKNSLLLFNLNEKPDGTPRPAPKTCARAIGYQIDDARTDGELRVLKHDPAYQRATIVRIIGNRAHARIGDEGIGDRSEIYLLRRKDGWRVDYTNFSPFDGSSGR